MQVNSYIVVNRYINLAMRFKESQYKPLSDKGLPYTMARKLIQMPESVNNLRLLIFESNVFSKDSLFMHKLNFTSSKYPRLATDT